MMSNLLPLLKFSKNPWYILTSNSSVCKDYQMFRTIAENIDYSDEHVGNLWDCSIEYLIWMGEWEVSKTGKISFWDHVFDQSNCYTFLEKFQDLIPVKYLDFGRSKYECLYNVSAARFFIEILGIEPSLLFFSLIQDSVLLFLVENYLDRLSQPVYELIKSAFLGGSFACFKYLAVRNPDEANRFLEADMAHKNPIVKLG